jgi:hypothetical protein
MESKVTEHRPEQSAKQRSSNKKTLLGMQIAFSEEQSENARSSISASREPDSNVNVARDEHDEKHSFPRNTTEAGIQMDRREMQRRKALSPISFKCDRGTNMTSEREP